METFKLYHTALYAKHHYKREHNQNIWADMQVILTLDGYSGEYMDIIDIVRVVLNQCQLLPLRVFKDLTTFADGISMSGCWRYGYYTRGNAPYRMDDDTLPIYDYNEAILRYCLSGLLGAEVRDLCGEGNSLPQPDYKKGLPKPKKK